METKRDERKALVSGQKRAHIMKAARAVFEAEGLEGASLRAIAAQAGYTPAALYFHFDSKEALYAEVLRSSLAALGDAVDQSIVGLCLPEDRLKRAAMAFFNHYAAKPRDLDLGFYLFRGGMKPAGLGSAHDEKLNAALQAALQPVAAAAEALGASAREARLIMVEIFAHATGLLLLLHTGRIRMFGASAPGLMEAYVKERVELLRMRRAAPRKAVPEPSPM
ncbi:AcrR family transcriptional regulator [Rhodoligotrophos appendicifer]|uniref:TetR/AcrR family transcriptional regulator n=1 Tax=Rhodoligotrophos appendicifer TaxID=987056 RepID=UPI001184D503|nr:TetR/AcrR family transcriptional regulator [Rhodoligotrophos appendicifer]